MKTLYININNEQIQSNEELEVLEHDLDGDFFFYFGGKIAKGCNVDNEYAVITDFNTEDYKEEYKQIITQWNEIKTILFSEECKGKFELTLPSDYIHWLRYSVEYNHVYNKNFSNGEPIIIPVDLEELYEESVEYMQREMLRRLKRDDLYLDIDEVVFNDDAVTRKSPIVRFIKEKYEGIGFNTYKKWLQKNGEIPQKPKAPSPVCDKCGKDPCECTLSSYDFFPLENVVLHKTSCSSILQEHLEYRNNLIYYEPKPGLVFIQQKRDTFFSIVSISEEEAYPKLWRSLLELKWGESYNACISIVKKKGYKYRVEDLDGGGAWTNKLLVLSIDEKYIFEFSFLHCKLNLIRAFLNRCPHCKSNNLMLLEHFNSDEIKMKCMDCGLLLIDGLGIECPECRSENIKDDGSSYLQYTCKICGHNWGGDYDDDDDNDGILTFENFFPVCGITLGKSTLHDVQRQKELYVKIKYYDGGTVIATVKETKHGGCDIRKEEGSNLFTHISMNTRFMFPEWSELGFNWELSYNDWVSLFKRMGFTVIQTIEPEVCSGGDEPDFLSATLVSISKDRSLKFQLCFSCRPYGMRGTTTDSPSTLYSIDVYSKGYSLKNDYGEEETFYNIEDIYSNGHNKYL